MRRTPYIRVLAALAALTLAIGPVATPSAHAEIAPTATRSYSFSGSGWGHGIGMSQYGAQGSALAGKDHVWILKHYYTGVVLGTVDTPEAKVNIDSAYTSTYSAYAGRTSWTIRSIDSPLELSRTGNSTVTLAANTYYVLTVSGSTVSVKSKGGTLVGSFGGSCWAVPKGPAATYPPLIEIEGASGPSNSGWVRYRGRMLVDVKPSNRLALINHLNMDQYLYGVVPRESPASWEQEALRAQAVAARSYAFADVVGGNILKCTTYSQVYNGHSRLQSTGLVMHEASSTNAAVDATSKKVVKKTNGAVVKTYFFSTSGGHTANNEDVWGGTALPEMRGVDDTYESRARPALAPWPATASAWPSSVPAPKLIGASTSWWPNINGLQLADQLRTVASVPASPAYVSSISPNRAASGHVRYVDLTFSTGVKVRVTGDTMRSKLKLPSTRFMISGFPMSRIQGSDRYATAVEISKKAFVGTAPVVVLASGEDYADALCGSAVAGAKVGALLLTARTSLPSTIEAEMKRLKPGEVLIMGSSAAVGTAVEARVKAVLPSASVTRIQGRDRYETARAAADAVYGWRAPTKAIVVNGTAWPDAASVSALAYAKSYPILFARPTELGTATAGYLSANQPAVTYIIGSETVVPAEVATEITSATGKPQIRLSGANRYATAAAVARQSISAAEGFTLNEIYITTGLQYPDALVGGMLAGKGRHPLLLTGFDSCPADTATFLTGNKPAITYIWILGGAGAISSPGAAAIDSVMMN